MGYICHDFDGELASKGNASLKHAKTEPAAGRIVNTTKILSYCNDS